MTGQQGFHRSATPHRLEPYRWLGAGAITLGIGAALAGGVGVAHADNGSGSPGHPHGDKHSGAHAHASASTPASSPTNPSGPTKHKHAKSGNHTAAAPDRSVTALVSSETATPAVATAAVRVVPVTADPSGGRSPADPHSHIADVALAVASRRTTHNSVAPVAAQPSSSQSHDTVTPTALAAVPAAATPSAAAPAAASVVTQVGNFVANAITGTIKTITGTIKAVVNQVWYLGLSLEAAVLNIVLSNPDRTWVVSHDSSGYYLEWKFNTWTI